MFSLPNLVQCYWYCLRNSDTQRQRRSLYTGTNSLRREWSRLFPHQNHDGLLSYTRARKLVDFLQRQHSYSQLFTCTWLLYRLFKVASRIPLLSRQNYCGKNVTFAPEVSSCRTLRFSCGWTSKFTHFYLISEKCATGIALNLIHGLP